LDGRDLKELGQRVFGTDVIRSARAIRQRVD